MRRGHCSAVLVGESNEELAGPPPRHPETLAAPMPKSLIREADVSESELLGGMVTGVGDERHRNVLALLTDCGADEIVHPGGTPARAPEAHRRALGRSFTYNQLTSRTSRFRDRFTGSIATIPAHLLTASWS